jgi:hypothetical protein
VTSAEQRAADAASDRSDTAGDADSDAADPAADAPEGAKRESSGRSDRGDAARSPVITVTITESTADAHVDINFTAAVTSGTFACIRHSLHAGSREQRHTQHQEYTSPQHTLLIGLLGLRMHRRVQPELIIEKKSKSGAKMASAWKACIRK